MMATKMLLRSEQCNKTEVSLDLNYIISGLKLENIESKYYIFTVRQYNGYLAFYFDRSALVDVRECVCVCVLNAGVISRRHRLKLFSRLFMNEQS